MTLAIILILAFVGLISFMNRFLPFKVCQVCAGVSGTWLTLTGLTLSGVLSPADYVVPTAILMGGTVVGIVNQVEKVFPRAVRRPIVWKLSVLLSGFLLAYAALRWPSWTAFSIEAIILVVLAYLFFVWKERGEPHRSHPTDSASVKKIETNLESCC